MPSVSRSNISFPILAADFLPGPDRTGTRPNPTDGSAYSVVQRPRNRHAGAVAALTILLGMTLACALPDEPAQALPDAAITASASPAVTAVVHRDGLLQVHFSQVMQPGALTDAVRLYRLNDHAFGDLDRAGTAIAVEAAWLDADRAGIRFTPQPGNYVFELLPTLHGRNDRPLDGLTDRPRDALPDDSPHRPDEDWLDGPATYRSAVFRIGQPDKILLGLPAHPYVRVERIDTWQGLTPSSPRTENPELFWLRGESRMAAWPPWMNNRSLRLELSSPAGHPWDLVAGPALAGQVAVRTEDGSGLRLQLDLAQQPGVAWGLGDPPRVVAVGGRAVTVDTGPSGFLNQYRKAQDPLWIRFGDNLPPRAALARVAQYENRQFVIDAAPVEISGSIHGTTASTDRHWPDGALDGGWQLRPAAGPPIRIEAATGTTLYLRAATVETDCTPCTVEWVDLAERVRVGDAATLISPVWYIHPVGTWPPSRILLLELNANRRLRSMPGQPFRNEIRSGNERAQPPEADDTFRIQFSVRPHETIQPPVSRLNDSRLYPTVFTTQAWDCLGDRSAPVCVLPPASEACTTPVRGITAAFSLYTADGNAAAPLGREDLLESDRIREDQIRVIDGRSGRGLDRRVDTRVVLNQTEAGLFPTTVVEVELRETESNTCGLRGFRAGDRLVISYNLRPLVPSDPRTLDGNGDGVASASPEDDWVGIYDPDRGTFVPLVRLP